MLSSHRQKNRLERLRQLEQLGFSMPFEFSLVNNRPPEVEIEQCASEQDCPVMDLPDNRTLFVVWVSLWAERPGVRLWDFHFEPPWRDHGFVRLPIFADSHIGDYYHLPGGLEYPRVEVLNLNFLKAGWRLPSIRVEGVLCALSDTPIPQEYRHGAVIPVSVRFFDRAGQQLAETTVTLWADRLTHRPQRRSTRRRGERQNHGVHRTNQQNHLQPHSGLVPGYRVRPAGISCTHRTGSRKKEYRSRARFARAVTEPACTETKRPSGFAGNAERNVGNWESAARPS